MNNPSISIPNICDNRQFFHTAMQCWRTWCTHGGSTGTPRGPAVNFAHIGCVRPKPRTPRLHTLCPTRHSRSTGFVRKVHKQQILNGRIQFCVMTVYACGRTLPCARAIKSSVFVQIHYHAREPYAMCALVSYAQL